MTDSADNEPSIPKYEYTALDEDEKHFEKIDAEEREEGIKEETYECPLCKWGDGGQSESSPEILQAFYNIYRSFFMTVHEPYLYKMLADFYNSKVILPQIKLKLNGDMKCVTPAQIRYHLTKCDASNKLLHAWEDIQFFRQAQTQLRRRGVFVKTPDGSKKIDISHARYYIEMSRQKLALLKYTDELEEKRKKIQKNLKNDGINNARKTTKGLL